LGKGAVVCAVVVLLTGAAGVPVVRPVVRVRIAAVTAPRIPVVQCSTVPDNSPAVIRVATAEDAADTSLRTTGRVTRYTVVPFVRMLAVLIW
jgi:hypothetical protein